MGVGRITLGFLVLGLAWQAYPQTPQTPQSVPVHVPRRAQAALTFPTVTAFGEVITTARAPLQHAEVIVRDSTNRTVASSYSNDAGNFIVNGLGRGARYTFIIRRLGFAPDTTLMTTELVDDTMWVSVMLQEHAAPTLATVKVVGKRSGLLAKVVDAYNKIGDVLDRVDSIMTKIDDNTLNRYCRQELRLRLCIGREPPPYLPRPEAPPPPPFIPPDSQLAKPPVDSQMPGQHPDSQPLVMPVRAHPVQLPTPDTQPPMTPVPTQLPGALPWREVAAP